MLNGEWCYNDSKSFSAVITLVLNQFKAEHLYSNFTPLYMFWYIIQFSNYSSIKFNFWNYFYYFGRRSFMWWYEIELHNLTISMKTIVRSPKLIRKVNWILLRRSALLISYAKNIQKTLKIDIKVQLFHSNISRYIFFSNNGPSNYT